MRGAPCKCRRGKGQWGRRRVRGGGRRGGRKGAANRRAGARRCREEAPGEGRGAARLRPRRADPRAAVRRTPAGPRSVKDAPAGGSAGPAGGAEQPGCPPHAAACSPRWQSRSQAEGAPASLEGARGRHSRARSARLHSRGSAEPLRGLACPQAQPRAGTGLLRLGTATGACGGSCPALPAAGGGRARPRPSRACARPRGWRGWPGPARPWVGGTLRTGRTGGGRCWRGARPRGWCVRSPRRPLGTCRGTVLASATGGFHL